MYYYEKQTYGQKETKTWVTHSSGCPVDERKHEWWWLDGDEIRVSASFDAVKGPIVVGILEDKPQTDPNGKYYVMVEKNGEVVRLPGTYKNKSEATRLLPGLALIYEYAIVVKKEYIPRVGPTHREEMLSKPEPAIRASWDLTEDLEI